MNNIRNYLIILFVCNTICLNAQNDLKSDKYTIMTNRFWSNWFVNINGGTQMYFGEYDKLLKAQERLTPALDIAVGKWYTPSIGTRLMYSGLFVNGVTKNGDFATRELFDANQNLYMQKIDMMNLHADLMFNVSNMLLGYNPKRFYHFIPYAGVGGLLAWKKNSRLEFGIVGGILNTFRLCPGLDLNLDIRGTIIDDNFDKETGGFYKDGLASVTLGLTCYFKKTNWTRPTKKRGTDSDIDREFILMKMREINEERDSLAQKLDSVIYYTQKNELEKSQLCATPYFILFSIGSSSLTNDAKVNLHFLAEIIKKGPSAQFLITGYADEVTGSSSMNKRLSKKRAENTYNYLTQKLNVPKEQLLLEYKGGTKNLFYNNPKFNRAVIIKTIH